MLADADVGNIGLEHYAGLVVLLARFIFGPGHISSKIAYGIVGSWSLWDESGRLEGHTGAICVLLVEAAVDDAAFLVFETLRPGGRRGRASSICAVHGCSDGDSIIKVRRQRGEDRAA
jgi:hypothetical protein